MATSRTRSRRPKAAAAASSGEAKKRPNYEPTLKPIDRSSIPTRTYPSKAGALVQEFAGLDADAVQVEDASRHFNVRLKEFIERHPEFRHIKVSSKGGETFMEKVDVSENGQVSDEE